MSLAILIVNVLASAGGPSGEIAYLSGTSPQNLTVCVIDIQSGVVEVVGDGRGDGRPAWSPDGGRIAHTIFADGVRRVRVVDADGKNGRVLPRGSLPGSVHSDPAWSAEGRLLAYSAGSPGFERVVVHDLDRETVDVWGGAETGDTEPVLMASTGDGETTMPVSGLLNPVWVEPDRLVSVGRVGRPGSMTTDLFWVTRDAVTRIDEAMPQYGSYMEWGPVSPGAGDFLAFESDDGGDREIFVYAARRGVFDVSNHRAADWNPRWSPDRRNIAFESFRSGRRAVYRVNALRVLVSPVSGESEGSSWDPAWSVDGKWIAFVSDRSGGPAIYLTPSDAVDAVRVTESAGMQLAPAWRPTR